MDLQARQQAQQRSQLIVQLKYEKSQLTRRMEVTEQGILALSQADFSAVGACGAFSAVQAMCAVQLSQLKLALVEGQERLQQIDAALQKLTSTITTATLVTPNAVSL